MSKTIPFHFINTMQQALIEVFDKSKHADRMIDKYLRANPKWSAEERKLFADSLYEIVKNKLLLAFLAESDELLKIIGVYFLKKSFKLQARPELSSLQIDKINKRDLLNKEPWIQYSIPSWLDDLGKKQFAQRWPALIKSFQDVPKTYLRANRIKINADSLVLELKKESIGCKKLTNNKLNLEDCLEVLDKKNIFSTQCYRNGFFEMQDAGSQSIATLLQLQPNMSVVDACSGSGGKSLHIASILKNSGSILSMDVQGFKLNDLKERAVRAGVTNIETQLIDNPKVIKRLEKKFDRVLLDVPCSGLGVLKRNPDSKWKLSMSGISELIETQKNILKNYSEMCKVNGVLVYATCSILNEENEEQVRLFLNSAAGKKWSLLSQHRIWPDESPTDGFYAAVLKRGE